MSRPYYIIAARDLDMPMVWWEKQELFFGDHMEPIEFPTKQAAVRFLMSVAAHNPFKCVIRKVVPSCLDT